MQLVLEMAVPQYPSINPSNTHVEEIWEEKVHLQAHSCVTTEDRQGLLSLQMHYLCSNFLY
jgi:hypothetical protein